MGETLTGRNRFRGVLLGTAVGDALGLPAEGISRQRVKKLFHGRWRHRFVMGRGMISDDTEHTVFVGQSLLAHLDSAKGFAKRLSWCLRWWLVSLPAGIGLATLRSTLRLWVGFGPSKSGVYSAGNGPAMRSAIVGAFFASSPAQMEDFLRASTIITHTDPRALTAARAVARLTAWAIRENLNQRPDLDDFLSVLQSCGQDDEEWAKAVASIRNAHDHRLPVEQFADALGLFKGVTGYAYHTVPVAVYAWYKHFGDFEETVSKILDCGGDTDSTAAIAGALAGATVGEQGIPRDWLDGIVDWPRGLTLLRKLGDELSEKNQHPCSSSPLRYFWPGLLVRNPLFMAVVLLHGLRRMAPPY